MRKFLLIFTLVLATGILFQVLDFAQGGTTATALNPNAIPFQVNTQAANKNIIHRLGINLGGNSYWGANQLLRNVLWDPGFEGYLDRILVIVTGSTKTSFTDEKNWGYADGYWNGATFYVQSGNAAGTKGTIATSLKQNANGLPQYTATAEIPPLAPNDIVILTKTVTNNPLYTWSSPTPANIAIDPSQKRPNSPGVQSLLMKPQGSSWGSRAQLDFYLDTLKRAGKLLLVDGNWQFTIWAKAEGTNPVLEISFSRGNGTAPFLQQSLTPTNAWQQYTFNFTGVDNGDYAPLTFSITAKGDNSAKIWLDDLWLGAAQSASPVFRQEVVDALTKLNPSYIRSEGLSDSFANWTAVPFGRKSFSAHVYGSISQYYSYALGDYLKLCQLVKANPWIIVPETLTMEEYQQLGSYLAQNANSTIFDNVIVEYGNESWNWMFRPTVIPYGNVYGPVFEKAMQAIKSGAGSAVKLTTIANGQGDGPNNTMQFLQASPSADVVDIAAYCFGSLDTGLSEKDTLAVEFVLDGDGKIQKNATNILNAGKKFAVYEVNLHTTGGTATSAERNPFVAGAVSGSALAQRLLYCMLLGADPIVLYSLAQYDTTAENGQLIYLWGVTRDLSPTKRFRPTGLIATMFNQAINPELHQIQPTQIGQTNQNFNLTMAAFKSPTQWSAAIVSANNADQVITIQFPNDGLQLPTKALTLTSPNILADNETSEQVTIVPKTPTSSGRIVEVTIPAYGFVVLTQSQTAATTSSSLTIEQAPAPTTTTEPPATVEPTMTPTQSPTQTQPTQPQKHPRHKHKHKWWQKD